MRFGYIEPASLHGEQHRFKFFVRAKTEHGVLGFGNDQLVSTSETEVAHSGRVGGDLATSPTDRSSHPQDDEKCSADKSSSITHAADSEVRRDPGESR